MMLKEHALFVPRLSGGVFLSLLDAAKKSVPVKRKQFGSDGSGISMPEMLIDLIKIAEPSRTFPQLDNLRSSVSSYRTCIISASAHFPFDDRSFVTAFSDRMSQHYTSALASMHGFVDKYFCPEDMPKNQRLVKGLLELIQTDDTITDTDEFVYIEGKPMFKSMFCNQTEYDLVAFLLAVWFFIVQERPDNSVGKETFLQWHTQRGKRAQWRYNGDAGSTITRSIDVYIPKLPEVQNEEPVAISSEDESNSALSRSKDVDRINALWASVQGTRLDPIKKEDEIAPSEMAYVYPLFAAYAQKLQRPVRTKSDLTKILQMDLEIRRQHFYDAETVRLQGEHALGSIIRSEFDDLKRDILSSVWNTYVGDYPNGFMRMKQVMNEASKANCTKGKLVKTGWIGSGEKQGIGHMLAAEKQLVWAVDDNDE